MENTERRQLAEFLAPAISHGLCGLYLPRFTGARIDLGQPAGDLLYPGGVYTDHDTKAAMRVFGFVAGAVPAERLQLVDAGQLVGRAGFPGGFLFGSRSNPTTPLWPAWFAADRVFEFEFGDRWTVVWEHANRYSMPDPSRLGRAEYESQTDYGIVARMTRREPASGGFILAGLGGRATEGCGIYLAENWKRLHARHGRSDFCLLLRFPPPIDPARSEVVHERGLSP